MRRAGLGRHRDSGSSSSTTARREQEANRRHEEFVRGWGGAAGYRVVEPAHMELAQPSIGVGLRRLRGGRRLEVVSWRPTSSGRAGTGPRTSRRWPRPPPLGIPASPISWPRRSAPIPLLRDVVDERVRHCLAHVAGSGPPCEMCAGAGAGCHLS